MFVKILDSDIQVNTILSEIIKSNEQILGAKISNLVHDIQASSWKNLSFANTPPLRAAVGYQLCQNLLGETDPVKCGNKAYSIGLYYATQQNNTPGMMFTLSTGISVCSEIFLQPLVTYLDGALELRHELLILLSRYRQRSEWFTERTAINDLIKQGGDLEKRLKLDFLRYLYDNEIDFSVESEVPSGGGEVDILAVRSQLGFLPIEVKVFDGSTRGVSYISGGIAQSYQYARKFNSPDAYYLIYNIAENKPLSLPGTSSASNVISIKINNITIHAIDIDLFITLPASQAKKLEGAVVPIPALGN